MAEKKISDLTGKENIGDNDELVFVDKATTSGTDAGVGGQTSKIKFSDLKDAVGTSGPQGSQGAKGSQGNAGNQGAKGSQGNPGNQGSQGRQGARGVQGFQGKQGAKGNNSTVAGPQGKQGAKGNNSTVAGPQGAQGKQGSVGGSGSPWGGGTFTGNVKINDNKVLNSWRVVNKETLFTKYIHVTSNGDSTSTDEVIIQPGRILVGANKDDALNRKQEGAQINLNYSTDNLFTDDDVARSINVDIFNDVDNVYKMNTFHEDHPGMLEWNQLYFRSHLRINNTHNDEYVDTEWQKSSPASNYTKPLVSKSTILARHNTTTIPNRYVSTARTNLFVSTGAVKVNTHLHLADDLNNAVLYTNDNRRTDRGINGKFVMRSSTGTAHDDYINLFTVDSITGEAHLKGSLVENSSSIQTSDIKLKKDIVSLQKQNSLDAIMKLNPVEFNYIDDSKNGNGKTLGLIAQEVEKVIPSIVSETKSIDSHGKVMLPNGVEDDGVFPLGDNINQMRITESDDVQSLSSEDDKIKCVAYSQLIPMLISTIQFQEQRIKDLESKLN